MTCALGVRRGATQPQERRLKPHNGNDAKIGKWKGRGVGRDAPARVRQMRLCGIHAEIQAEIHAETHAENDEPQPHVLFTFGLENLKPDP